MSVTVKPVGDLLREWRQRRRMSQLELSLEAEISARHLSFLETGRSQPSREMVLRLAERLDVPLRERNQMLQGHEPYPALAVDRHWTLVAANNATRRLMTGVSDALLRPPVNVLRLAL